MADQAEKQLITANLKLKCHRSCFYAPAMMEYFVLEEMYAYSEVQMISWICYYSFSKTEKCAPTSWHRTMIRSIYGGVEGKYIIWKTARNNIKRYGKLLQRIPDKLHYDEFMPDETLMVMSIRICLLNRVFPTIVFFPFVSI